MLSIRDKKSVQRWYKYLPLKMRCFSSSVNAWAQCFDTTERWSVNTSSSSNYHSKVRLDMPTMSINQNHECVAMLKGGHSSLSAPSITLNFFWSTSKAAASANAFSLRLSSFSNCITCFWYDFSFFCCAWLAFSAVKCVVIHCAFQPANCCG